jgi:hypothetical protein
LFYEELVVCGDEGRLKAWEQQDFLAGAEMDTALEILCGEGRPSRKTRPSYPALIERSGHHGATYYEHVRFIDSIEGKAVDAATALDGFWSIAVATAAQNSIRTGQIVAVNSVLPDDAQL